MYRVAWREMAALTGVRTLYPAIIPPGAKHVLTIVSAASGDSVYKTCVFGAVCSSYIVDFYFRALGMGHLGGNTLSLAPTIEINQKYTKRIVELYLRLNCCTSAYAPLWEENIGTPWTRDVPVRNAYERLRVQTEIDALVGIEFGLDLEEILTIYRTQFPVLRKYDQERLFDANGRSVPKPLVDVTDPEQLVWTHPQSGMEYQLVPPFKLFDREQALIEYYQAFTQQ